MESPPIIGGVAAAILTPLIMVLWSKYAPPAKYSDFDSIDPKVLRDRNNWIEVVGQFLSITGIFVPLGLMALGVTPTLWLVGLGFGLMVILPVSFIAAATYRGGIQRYREFWRFYELKWNISLRTIKWLYVLLAVLGVVSSILLLAGI